jgi:hypothetical protein
MTEEAVAVEAAPAPAAAETRTETPAKGAGETEQSAVEAVAKDLDAGKLNVSGLAGISLPNEDLSKFAPSGDLADTVHSGGTDGANALDKTRSNSNDQYLFLVDGQGVSYPLNDTVGSELRIIQDSKAGQPLTSADVKQAKINASNIAAEQPAGANTPLEYKQGDNITLPDGTSGQFVRNEGNNVIITVNGEQQAIPVPEFANSDFYEVKPIESGPPPAQAVSGEQAAPPATEPVQGEAADAKPAQAETDNNSLASEPGYKAIHDEIFADPSWTTALDGAKDGTVSPGQLKIILDGNLEEAATKFVESNPDRAAVYAKDHPEIRKAIDKRNEASAAETKDSAADIKDTEAKITPELQKTIDTQVDKRLKELGLGNAADIAETMAAMLKLLEDKGVLKKEEAEKNKKMNLMELLLKILGLITIGATMAVANSAEVVAKKVK